MDLTCGGRREWQCVAFYYDDCSPQALSNVSLTAALIFGR